MTELTGRWGLDSNIFVYSLVGNSIHHKRMIEFWMYATSENVDLFLSHQNFLEVLNVLGRYYKFNLETLKEDLVAMIDAFSIKMIFPLATTLDRSNSIANWSKPRELFDSYLASTYLDNSISGIVTANEKHFAKIDGMSVFNPIKETSSR